MSTIQVRDGRTSWAVTVAGDEGARPLVLVHGWGASAASWAAHLPRLTGQLIVPDLPGHGDTPGYTPTTTVPAIVTGLAAVLRALLGTPAVVVGHSMGGQVAVLLARDHPELVRAAAVIDPAYGADDRELTGCPSQLTDLRQRGAESAAEFVDRACDPKQVPALWRAARRQMLATAGPVLADLYQSMYLDDGAIGGRVAAAACLAQLRVPVLALYSDDAPAAWARSLTSWSAHSRVVTWPGRTHYLHQEDPAAFCDLLLTWCG